jgi:hypothetical protein
LFVQLLIFYFMPYPLVCDEEKRNRDQQKMSTDDAPASSLASGKLFERIGGMRALINAVDILCDMVLKDDMLAPLFAGVDMGRHRIKQVRVQLFCCRVFLSALNERPLYRPRMPYQPAARPHAAQAAT